MPEPTTATVLPLPSPLLPLATPAAEAEAEAAAFAAAGAWPISGAAAVAVAAAAAEGPAELVLLDLERRKDILFFLFWGGTIETFWEAKWALLAERPDLFFLSLFVFSLKLFHFSPFYKLDVYNNPEYSVSMVMTMVSVNY